MKRLLLLTLTIVFLVSLISLTKIIALEGEGTVGAKIGDEWVVMFSKSENPITQTKFTVSMQSAGELKGNALPKAIFVRWHSHYHNQYNANHSPTTASNLPWGCE